MQMQYSIGENSCDNEEVKSGEKRKGKKRDGEVYKAIAIQVELRIKNIFFLAC